MTIDFMQRNLRKSTAAIENYVTSSVDFDIFLVQEPLCDATGNVNMKFQGYRTFSKKTSRSKSCILAKSNLAFMLHEDFSFRNNGIQWFENRSWKMAESNQFVMGRTGVKMRLKMACGTWLEAGYDPG